MDSISNKQKDLNNLMASAGRDRYRQNAHKNEEKGRSTLNPPIRRLLGAATEELTRSVSAYIKGKPLGLRKHLRKNLHRIKPKVIAYITCKTVLDSIAENRSYLSIAGKVACALEDEARFLWVKDNYPEEFEKYLFHVDSKIKLYKSKTETLKEKIKNADDIHFNWTPWGRILRLQIGQVFIEQLIKCSNLIIREKNTTCVSGKFKTTEVLKPSKETLKWIERADIVNEDLSPLYLPMVDSPLPWINPFSGGYHDNVIMRWNFIKTSKKICSQMTQEQIPEVYKALNSLQDVSLKVNNDIFEVFDYLWSEGVEVGGLPSREDFLPEKIKEIEGDKAKYREYCLAKITAENKNRSNQGKRIMVAKIHWIARNFLNIPFYFPYKLDFRGRLNVIPTFLTPQSNDLGKGLLVFSNGEPFKDEASLDWYKIHGANVFGKDKLTYEDRVKWVDDNSEFIYNIYLDPIDNLEWAKADKPFQFLSWAMEYGALQDHAKTPKMAVLWSNIEKEKKEFLSYIPCAVDATCSGLQILSLLLKDSKAAESTNVKNTGKVADIYQEVADKTLILLNKTIAKSKDVEEIEIGQGWLKFFNNKIPRKAVKRIVMTVCYSATPHSARVYLEEYYNKELEEKDLRNDRPFPKTFKATLFLSKLILEATASSVASAYSVMTWLKEIAEICTKGNKPLTWITPTGFIIEQKCCSNEMHIIRTAIGDKFVFRKDSKKTIPCYKKKHAHLESNKLSSRKQSQSISPNLIHSLDAAVLIKGVNYFTDSGCSDILTVHDSFSTHATNLSLLAGCLRKSVHDIFSVNQLQNFKEQIEEATKLKLPNPPKGGDLDIDEVLTSTYLFS